MHNDKEIPDLRQTILVKQFLKEIPADTRRPPEGKSRTLSTGCPCSTEITLWFVRASNIFTVWSYDPKTKMCVCVHIQTKLYQEKRLRWNFKKTYVYSRYSTSKPYVTTVCFWNTNLHGTLNYFCLQMTESSGSLTQTPMTTGLHHLCFLITGGSLKTRAWCFKSHVEDN